MKKFLFVLCLVFVVSACAEKEGISFKLTGGNTAVITNNFTKKIEVRAFDNEKSEVTFDSGPSHPLVHKPISVDLGKTTNYQIEETSYGKLYTFFINPKGKLYLYSEGFDKNIYEKFSRAYFYFGYSLDDESDVATITFHGKQIYEKYD